MKINSTCLLLVLVLWVLFSCKKEEELQKLTILKFSPQSGPYASSVTIEGTGFSSNPAENKVKFNNVEALVKTATPNQLVVEVPKGAGTGPITIQVNSKTATGEIYEYKYTATVSTFAGSGEVGLKDGTGTSAQFHRMVNIAVDVNGNLYTAGGSAIRKITPAAVVSTLAGSIDFGLADGTGSKALFQNTRGVTTDIQGNVYVTDITNDRIRKITPAGVVTTKAGRGRGFEDGNASSALFFEPASIVLDAQGNFYISDRGNGRIRKITPTGMVSTFAGSGNPAPYAFADGAGSAAHFYGLHGIAIDKQGNLYVADEYNNRIRKITPAGMVSTLAGASLKGFADSDGTSPALFNHPVALAVDGQGNVYVADYSNHSIRMITPAGVVSTIAGNGKLGYKDGAGHTAQFHNPSGIAVDAKGNIYVVDSSNVRIRKIILE